MANALTIYSQFDTLQRAATALQASQYFKDAETKAQAITKVLAGAELGLPPFASMTGIHIIQGKPALGANVIATLIKNDPRYNYKVLELSDDVCRIEFYEDGQPCGISEFTKGDASKAAVKNMNKFPRNMLFARAISNGAKWYAAGIFGGAPVYTPEELGADVDEDGDIITGEIVENDPPSGTWDDVVAHGATATTTPPKRQAIVPKVADVKVASTIADLRASIEGVNGKLTLGFVAKAAFDTGVYDNFYNALNAVGQWPDKPEAMNIEQGVSLKTETGLAIFDWLIDRRKAQPALIDAGDGASDGYTD